MVRNSKILLSLISLVNLLNPPHNHIDMEEEARVLVNEISRQYPIEARRVTIAKWNFEANMTEENQKLYEAAEAEFSRFERKVWKAMSHFPWQNFTDPVLKRKFMMKSLIGQAVLSDKKLARYNTLITEMKSSHSMAKLCAYKTTGVCNLTFEPDVMKIMAESKDPEELKHIWSSWRDVFKEDVKHKFEDYVKLSNEACFLNGFPNCAAYWQALYESPEIINLPWELDKLWTRMKPLYEEMHAYVRRKLILKYGPDLIHRSGGIPAHLLGNMWAQRWNNIFNLTQPYPDIPTIDITDSLVKQNYTPLKMFKLAESFFTSMNMSAMPPLFWKNSIFEKPTDKTVTCHASAWDFYDGQDYRVKQCTRTNMLNLATVHHEMGHIQYFMEYRNQPFMFKDGANPGFQEAVGDVIFLSMITPKHLKSIGLLPADFESSYMSDINHLFHVALEKVALLPFGYVTDLWRWNVFNGKVTADHYNCHWWKLRELYQGVIPPVQRSEADFDPVSKYHIAANVPYIRYFISIILQFQIHRALCIKAGQYDPDTMSPPLHHCDIYNSTEAGSSLRKMMSLGKSRPWTEVLEVVTGSRNMEAGAMREYMAPLEKWLRENNRRYNQYIGWTKTGHHCLPVSPY
ncbi:angiotensin-converting enzyme-like [Periplaneta americana]|uniref:angiotensin-converting enzyme-like n=1 Tax=Periplaneta americana TaxID=6978 RepID=UPI0037E734EB